MMLEFNSATTKNCSGLF